MKELMDKMFKNEKNKKFWQFLLIILIGAALMYMGKAMEKGSLTAEKEKDKNLPEIQSTETPDYESALSKRLSEILSKVEGVGKVDVLLTLSYKDEVTLAEDVVKERTESAGAGGAEGKTNLTERTEQKHVLVQGDGGNMEPIIIKRQEPKIEGVIIVAEGGDDAAIKASLTKAAEALLNLPAHKIEILKMKNQ